MANCSANFRSGDVSYLSKISLSNSKKDQLLKSSNALREKIRSHLIDKGVKSPKFYRQGSYAQQTLVTPLNEDYDIDDGIYLDLKASSIDVVTTTVHNWVYEAVEDHTQNPPQDKETCVRAVFKDGYHVDLPIYKIETDILGKSEIYLLAKKSKGWEESDPRAANSWFRSVLSEYSEQVRRFVKYAKAWADFQESRTSNKLPGGLSLTILIGEEYKSDARDDIGFLETVRTIKNRLNINSSIWKPYMPTENMRGYLTDPQFNNFLTALDSLVSAGDIAINENSSKEAALSWRKVLGERFPVFEDPSDGTENQAKKYNAPAIVGTNLRSA